MMRNPRPEEQLRGGNEPWERKFEGKSGQAQIVGSSPNSVEFEFSYHDVATFNEHS